MLYDVLYAGSEDKEVNYIQLLWTIPPMNPWELAMSYNLSTSGEHQSASDNKEREGISFQKITLKVSRTYLPEIISGLRNGACVLREAIFP